MRPEGSLGLCLCVQGAEECVITEIPLPAPAGLGLLVRSLEYNQPADNYTVCQGDNATLR
uniref:Uncharacterized protein n=1 Tax=Pelusios castaneus TaxID=367368 RepID=A0A8C8RPS3_9SAUR